MTKYIYTERRANLPPFPSLSLHLHGIIIHLYFIPFLFSSSRLYFPISLVGTMFLLSGSPSSPSPPFSGSINPSSSSLSQVHSNCSLLFIRGLSIFFSLFCATHSIKYSLNPGFNHSHSPFNSGTLHTSSSGSSHLFLSFFITLSILSIVFLD